MIKPFERKPETAKAVKVFEQKTGIKVLRANFGTGSMRGYIGLQIDEKDGLEFYENFYNKKIPEFKRTQFYGIPVQFIMGGHYKNRIWFDILLTDLQ